MILGKQQILNNQNVSCLNETNTMKQKLHKLIDMIFDSESSEKPSSKDERNQRVYRIEI